MKIKPTLWPALLTLTLLLGTFPLLAQTEIAIEDDEPAPVQKAAPVPPKQAAPVQAAPAEQEEDESIEVEEEEGTEEKAEEKQAEPEPAAKEEEQVEEASTGSMQPVYEAGIRAYRQKSYWKAVALLSKAAEIKDPDTPKYYYAEAHAMLGVIFHFYLKKSDKACRHYQMALKIDPKTRTALKYRNRVCR